jgi:alpha-1,2-glucosyltransferase
LRGVNALLGISLPFLLADLLATVRFGANRPSWSLDQYFKESIVISGFPLVFFFNFLYYTDVASLVFVLLCYRQALKTKYVSSAFVSEPI